MKFQQSQLGMGMAEGIGNAQQGQETGKSICYVVNDTNNLEFLESKPFGEGQDKIPPLNGNSNQKFGSWQLCFPKFYSRRSQSGI